MAQSLKHAAQAAFIARKERIEKSQRGVLTYFDFYFAKVIKRLNHTKDIHGWDPEFNPLNNPEHAQMAQELRWLSNHLANEQRGRFVSYTTRRSDERIMPVTEIGYLQMMMSTGVPGCLMWKGQPLFKTVFDFALMPMLLSELKPSTIFEIGSGAGASAQWLADTAREQGIAVKIYSTDLTPPAHSCPGVQFLPGDCNDPVGLFPTALLEAAERPVLVLEDAHVNVLGVLTHFHKYLSPGDYLVVEDSGVKVQDLDAFMDVQGNHYAVDTRYTDFFGRNATCAPNSIFRKM